MTRIIIYLALLATTLFFGSCNNKPNLETYFVENQEKKGFVTFDVTPSILNINATKLSSDEKATLDSFEKMNILAFKVDDKNKAQFDLEKQKIKSILKDTLKYHELIDFGSGSEAVKVSFVGTDDNIKEFVLYGNQESTGFGIVRILGNNMKAENAMDLISILKNSDIDTEQLKAIKNIIK